MCSSEAESSAKLMRVSFAVILAATCIGLSACTVGPSYKRASAPVPAKWDVQEPWGQGAPKDEIPKGEWWSVFRDADLDALEKEALSANQDLKISVAHLEQARATAAIQVATLFPTLSTAPFAQRQRLSGNRPGGGLATVHPLTQSIYTLPFTVSYEVDLFGRRRRSIEAAQAAYQASAADLESVRLLVTSQLAADFFNLRQVDRELGILDRTVEALEKGLELVNSRHKGGLSSGLDVAQEETLLDSTRTQARLLRQQRKQFEDALAVLVGKPAPDFHLASKELTAEPPTLEVGLPSELLERRPDIAAAERDMAAANARIGVAKAAYFPALELFGEGGWAAADIIKLANVSSTLWAVGASAAEDILTGRSRPARVDFARAAWEASVASYRETVLSALREVQDSVYALTVLSQAQQSQQQAVAAAERALDISTSRYRGGLVSYLDVVTSQQVLLNNERQLAAIQGQRLVSSVLLVKALGGGWDASSLAGVRVKPKPKDMIIP